MLCMAGRCDALYLDVTCTAGNVLPAVAQASLRVGMDGYTEVTTRV